MSPSKEEFLRNIEKLLDDIFNETPSMKRNRSYNGQPWTDTGERGKQEVFGITMRDIKDCFVRAYIMSHDGFSDTEKGRHNKPYVDEANKGENASLCPSDMYKMKGSFDPIAVSQNLTCEIEKIMGIFPNIDKEKCDVDPTIKSIKGE